MKHLAVLLFLGTLLACQNADKEAVARLEGEVMAVHDEVMPKMEEIMNLQAELKKRNPTDSLVTTTADSLTRALGEADNAMSDWMAEYKTDAVKTLPPAEAKAYLEGEKRKIEDVKTKTNASIAAAQAFLKK
jgi:hypothetical protein